MAGYVFAWLILALALRVPSPLLAAASLVLLLGAWGYRLSGQLDRRFPIGPWALLWLVLRPPMGLDNQLIAALQHLSSRLSSQALDLIGVNHLMDGNALVLPDKELFVDEACSGIVSVISIATCAAMYGVWRRRGAVHTFLLILAGAAWATLLNVVRITTIALAHVSWQVDLAEGPAHTWLGLAIFACSLVTLVATDWLLRAALAEVGSRWDEMTGEEIRFGRVLVAFWDHLVGGEERATLASKSLNWSQIAKGGAALSIGVVPAVAFAGLGLTQVRQLLDPAAEAYVSPDRDAMATALQGSVMPDELAGLSLEEITYRKRRDDDVFGEHSVIYRYVEPTGTAYLVSCDFPFASGWHELSVCYEGIGWRLESREIQEAAEADSQPPYELAQLVLTKPDGRAALVTFCAFYENGDPVVAQRFDYWSQFLSRLTDNDSSTGGRRNTIQAQVVVERADAISDRDRRVSIDLLAEARRRFAETSVAQRP